MIGRRLIGGALVMLTVVAGAGCGGGGGGRPEVAATVAGTKILSRDTEALLRRYLDGQATEIDEGHERDERLDRREVARHVLMYQIRLAVLHRLATGLGVTPGPETKGPGPLSKAMAEALFPAITVSDADLRREFDRRAAVNHSTWRVTATVAGYSSADAAKALAGRLERGEPFDQAAQALGPASFGTAEITALSPLPPPVLDAMSQLQPGEVTAPVQVSAVNWAVIHATRREDLPALSLDAVRDELTRYLVDQQRQNLFQGWFDKQLQKARIKVAGFYGQWDSEEARVR